MAGRRKPFVAQPKTAKGNDDEKESIDDYMSKDVLEAVKTNIKQNEDKIVIKRKKKAAGPAKQLDHQTLRDIALSTPISESNVGFKLLKKLGYEEGKGLGREGEGIVDPLGLNLKRGREGLGFDEPEVIKKPKIANDEEIKSCTDEMINEFAVRQKDRFKEKKITGQLKASVCVCYKLDLEKEIGDNLLLPYDYLPIERKKDEEQFPREELSLTKKIEIFEGITFYLRKTHLYCFFCSNLYQSEEELEKLCPGLTEDDHQ